MLLAVQNGIFLEHLDFSSEIVIQRFNQLTELNDCIDALVFRSNIEINEESIQRFTGLKYLGLVSTGTDQVDLAYVNQLNAELVHAKGYNAGAVRDYVIQAIFEYILKFKVVPNVGVIGCGNIGGRVLQFLQKSGIEHGYYDPFVYPSKNFDFQNCDLITYHVALTQGKHATKEMVQESSLPAEAKIINTARGNIWQEDFFFKAQAEERIWCEDVYLIEPPKPMSISKDSLTTPHIAGYSRKGRLSAVSFVMKQIDSKIIEKSLPRARPWLLRDESALFKTDYSRFSQRRNTFPWIKEFSEYSEQEQETFFSHFQGVPTKLIEAIWN